MQYQYVRLSCFAAVNPRYCLPVAVGVCQAARSHSFEDTALGRHHKRGISFSACILLCYQCLPRLVDESSGLRVFARKLI